MKSKKKTLFKILGLELLIIFFFTVNGSYVTITKPSSLAMQFIGLLPLAAGVFLYFASTRRWNDYFFVKRVKSIKNMLQLNSPLLLVLLIVFIGKKGLNTTSVSDLFLVLIIQLLIVAFIEESFFRGFMLKILLPKGFKKAVFISSSLFAFTHSLQLLGGQSIETTILQIIYAFVVGMVLSLLIVNNQPIMIAIAFHGINNFLQIMGNTEGSSILSYLIIAILGAQVVFLWQRATTLSNIKAPNNKSNTSHYL